jgi:hypothetical protein
MIQRGLFRLLLNRFRFVGRTKTKPSDTVESRIHATNAAAFRFAMNLFGREDFVQARL